MRGDHIIKMLEERPVSRLGADEISLIEAHAADCGLCLRAYTAARVADSLTRTRANETVVVSPFFETRVMAAIRESRLSPELPAMVKAWHAARAILSAMAATVFVLIGLTVFTSSPEQGQLPEITASQSIFSPEFVILEDDDFSDDLLYDQVLGTVYDSEDVDGN